MPFPFRIRPSTLLRIYFQSFKANKKFSENLWLFGNSSTIQLKLFLPMTQDVGNKSRQQIISLWIIHLLKASQILHLINYRANKIFKQFVATTKLFFDIYDPKRKRERSFGSSEKKHFSCPQPSQSLKALWWKLISEFNEQVEMFISDFWGKKSGFKISKDHDSN